MDDEQFLRYCELHCRTERALFSREHVKRVGELAGHPMSGGALPEHVTLRPAIMDPLVAAGRARIDVGSECTGQHAGCGVCDAVNLRGLDWLGAPLHIGPRPLPARITKVEPAVLPPCVRPGGAGDWWSAQHASCTQSEHFQDPVLGIVERRCSCVCHKPKEGS